MQPHDILDFIDEFLIEQGDWLSTVTVDFALDVRSMVSELDEASVKRYAA